MGNSRGKRPKIHWEWVWAELDKENGLPDRARGATRVGTRRAGGGAAINIRVGHYLAFFPGFLRGAAARAN